MRARLLEAHGREASRRSRGLLCTVAVLASRRKHCFGNTVLKEERAGAHLWQHREQLLRQLGAGQVGKVGEEDDDAAGAGLRPPQRSQLHLCPRGRAVDLLALQRRVVAIVAAGQAAAAAAGCRWGRASAGGGAAVAAPLPAGRPAQRRRIGCHCWPCPSAMPATRSAASSGRCPAPWPCTSPSGRSDHAAHPLAIERSATFVWPQPVRPQFALSGALQAGASCLLAAALDRGAFLPHCAACILLSQMHVF